MSNRDKKYTPPARQRRTASAGAAALAKADQVKHDETTERLREAIIPSPVPYDRDELGSGRGLTYEWEYWIEQLQIQIDNIGTGGGGTGSGASYVHNQTTAASVWSITHNLSTKPGVTVIDPTGQELLAEIQWPNNQTVTVNHANPQRGTAYLRA